MRRNLARHFVLVSGFACVFAGCHPARPPAPPAPTPAATTTTVPPVPPPPPPPPQVQVREDLKAEAYGNFHTMGVILHRPEGVGVKDVSGARLFEVRSTGERRLLDPVWIQAIDAYVCSVFYLKPGTDYRFRAELLGTNGAPLAARAFAGSTRPEPGAPPPARAELHVATNGVDTAPGTAAQPLRTLAAALAAVSAPGTHVILHDGVYYEGDLYAPPRRGQPGAPLVVRAAPGATVILDGSDPAAFRAGWTALGGDLYRRPFTDATWLIALRDPRTGKATRAYPVETLEQLRNRHCGEVTPDMGNSFINPAITNTAFEHFNITAAYHCSGTELTVWCPGFDPRGAQELRVSVRTTGIEDNRASQIVYEGLTFRFFAGTALRVYNADDIIVRNCRFEYCNVPIGVKQDSNRLLVEGCTFIDDCTRWGLLPKFNEGFAYSAYIETGSVTLYPGYNGRGMVVRNNLIDGLFDGALLVPYMTPPTVDTSETDFYSNRIVRVLDDLMELDGFPRNVRVFNNRMEHFLTGISLAQGAQGPTYIVHNILGGHGDSSPKEVFGPGGYPVKLNGGDSDKEITGKVFFFHNTSWTGEADTPAFRIKTGQWRQFVCANNIWFGTRIGWDSYYMTPVSPVAMAHDIVWPGTGPLFHRDYGSPTDFLTAADVAARGPKDIQFLTNAIVANPQYTAPATGNYALGAGSPAIDAGVIIPGINDEHFAGRAPDIGALESGTPGAGEPFWP